MSTQRQQRLNEFTAWVAEHIRGDEKGEAQVYLDRLFRAFDHGGVSEAGAVLEERVQKGSGQAATFADLVSKPRVLIEMKKRDANLGKPFRQAFDYWAYLVPDLAEVARAWPELLPEAVKDGIMAMVKAAAKSAE